MKIKQVSLVAAGAIMLLTLAAPVRAADDPVVATVNGQNIHRSQVADAYSRLPAQYQQVPIEQIFPALLDSMIDAKLAAIQAVKDKVHETEQFKAELAAFRERLLGSTLIQNAVEAQVTAKAVSDRYSQVVKDLAGQVEVHARHILLKTEDEAKAVIKDLAGGADFADMAKKKSTGPSGPNGGDLGFFGKGQMVPEFEKAAFAMDKGGVSKTPVKTQFGWHVIKVEDKRAQKAPSLEEMEPQIRQSLTREIGAQITQDLRGKADIKRFNLDGTPAN